VTVKLSSSCTPANLYLRASVAGSGAAQAAENWLLSAFLPAPQLPGAHLDLGIGGPLPALLLGSRSGFVWGN